jgi:hypothetical protein
MPNKQHVNLLKQGNLVWNKWRWDNKDRGPLTFVDECGCCSLSERFAVVSVARGEDGWTTRTQPAPPSLPRQTGQAQPVDTMLPVYGTCAAILSRNQIDRYPAPLL